MLPRRKNCKIGAEVDHIKTELPEIRSNGELDEKLFHGEQKRNGDGDILGHDRLPTTPPNDDVFCKSVAETDQENEVGVGLQSTDRTVENASTTSISGFDPTAKVPNNPSKNRLGDIYDHETLVKAIKQVDVVILTLGHGPRQLADQVKIIAAIKEVGNIEVVGIL